LFELQRRVEFGSAIALCGAAEPLGAWQADAAPRMRWSEGDVWRAVVRLPTGAPMPFKPAVVSDFRSGGEEGVVSWLDDLTGAGSNLEVVLEPEDDGGDGGGGGASSVVAVLTYSSSGAGAGAAAAPSSSSSPPPLPPPPPAFESPLLRVRVLEAWEADEWDQEARAELQARADAAALAASPVVLMSEDDEAFLGGGMAAPPVRGARPGEGGADGAAEEGDGFVAADVARSAAEGCLENEATVPSPTSLSLYMYRRSTTAKHLHSR
jgi:hypothetical protein